MEMGIVSSEIQENKPSFTDTETNPDKVEELYPELDCFILERSMSKALEGCISLVLTFGQLGLVVTVR